MEKPQLSSQALLSLCENHRVKTLYAFGSILTDRFGSESDVDFLVDFSKISVEDYADNYFEFKFALQEMFKRPVDLLEQKALKNPYLIKSINEQKQLIYGE